MNNQKQLIFAWQTYADENVGRLIHNYHGGGTAPFANDPRNAPWAVGWLDWSTAADNTNINYLRNSRYSRLSLYLHQPKNIHKCPSDIYLSAIQRAKGWKERVRSYSMNLTIGEGNAMTGPWDLTYKQAKKLDELLFPSPDETTVFLDEHPDSINDPGLFPPVSTGFIDGPGNLHNSAGTIAFADSHIETHRWKGRLRQARVGRSSWYAPAGDPDVSWLSYHSQRRGPEFY